MIQGGGFTADMQQKPTDKPIQCESKNGLKNTRGTLAMARTSDPHSATSQFFINVKDNGFLDFPGQDGWGYCVFGKVTKGIEVVDAIVAVPSTTKAPHQNVPVDPITITKVTDCSVALRSRQRRGTVTDGGLRHDRPICPAWQTQPVACDIAGVAGGPRGPCSVHRIGGCANSRHRPPRWWARSLLGGTHVPHCVRCQASPPEDVRGLCAWLFAIISTEKGIKLVVVIVPGPQGRADG